MAVLIRNQRSNPLSDPPAAEPVQAVRATQIIAEAPDRGESRREAPESRLAHRAEAPDRGEGRMALLEHEFTRGRSQS
ncbi:MAG TPA: hypothetical protein VF590_12640 [Isosphaeraceae bacterium]|jgi:hypothetical protein